MKNDVIDLVTVTTAQDSDGFDVTVRTLFHCFADVQSAKGVEFYSAANAGMKISLVAVVNYSDYLQAVVEGNKPSIVAYDNDDYRIIRTYRVKKNDSIELTLQEVE